MTTLIERLRDEIRKTVKLDILHHEAAVELERLTAERDALKADQQRKIGALARYRIETQLVDQLLEEGPNTETTSLDMEYWNDQHDQLKAVLQERNAIEEQAVKNCDEVLRLREQMERQKEEWLSWEGKRRALEQDAARYRWLRDVAWNSGSLIFYAERYGPEDWDEAIDAARKATP